MLAASLLSPPDEQLLADLKQSDLRSFLEEHLSDWGGTGEILTGLFDRGDSPDALPVLQRAYDSLFGHYGERKISLVESTYKTWSSDKSCGMVFASSTGLIMGDCAVHMRQIYQQLELEIPEAFRSTPDHLSLELEFLALLYRNGSPSHIRQFIDDHLDWIPKLRDAVKQAEPHPFYHGVVTIIDMFLANEMGNKSVTHEKKTIH